MERVRTFIAIEIEPQLKEGFTGAQEKLKESRADVRWANIANTHLTLKFLGEVEKERLEEINAITIECTSEIEPFEVRFFGLGAFPTLKRPHVVWIGVKDGENELLKLNSCLEEKLAARGFRKEERGYYPHITLGRVKSPKGVDKLVETIAAGEEAEFGRMRAQEVVVMESKLKPDGPQYIPLYKNPLKGEVQ